MYNREKYIGECLDSLFAQTFQNFEVIVIDDCSTDNSIEIVKNYMVKFGERLKILQMEKNTGHPGEPRNRGITVARGEYIYCLDSDDMITATAFEELYTLAKEHNSDVVYCEKYYMSTGVGEEFKDNIRVADSRIQRPPFITEPTLETTDLEERVKNLLNWRYWMSPALKLVKRDLLIENNITFPLLVGSEDDVWSMEILFCAKRFLRIPNICFIRRIHEEGISFGEYTTPDHVQRWMDVTIRALKDLDNFMGKIEFFNENPSYRYDVLARSVKGSFTNIFDKCVNESAFDVYKIFQEKFGEYLGENDVLVSVLCAYIINQRKELSDSKKKSNQESQERISKQEEEIGQLKAKIVSMSSLLTFRLTAPAVSVIIPLYNAEEYIAECLDSLLAQTFKDFEVIVVDDCSTDGSLTIVENYAPKFNGRFIITKTEVNSKGGGYVPRNIGFNLARGKYVFFVDADDHLLDTALETLYNAAEEYDTDVVYLAARYTYWKPNDASLTRDGRGKELMAKGLEDKLTLTVDNPDENLHMLIQEKGFTTPWAHFVKRTFLIDNKIVFPEIPKAGDYIWAIHVYCYAKRFLRFTTPLYYYRNYNDNTVSKTTTLDQFSNWVLSFIIFAKTLAELSNKTEILRNNLTYSYEASSVYFNWCINRTKQARENLSNQDIYEILCNEFGKREDFADFSIPFLFSVIDSAKKISDSNSKAIDDLKKRFSANDVSTKVLTNCPAVSIIIPMYNAEKYIGECLDSILAQTFQDFEVIVVDDCSTDNSAIIVEIYALKFGGRLKLTGTKKNSGSPGEPGNVGVALSRGEYLLILDDDDIITPDALEKLYTVAKKFEADVVTCEKFYHVPEKFWYDVEFKRNLEPYSYQTGGFVTEPTLIPFDIVKRVQDCYENKFLHELWNKLIRRDLLINNEIRFADIVNQDFLATCCLIYTAKNVVRVPYVINFYRVRDDSLYHYHQECDPLKKLKIYLTALKIGFKHLDAFLSKLDSFKKNPVLKKNALHNFFKKIWYIRIRGIYNKIPVRDRDNALYEEFADAENTVLVRLLAYILDEWATSYQYIKISKFKNYFTARVDIQLVPKTGTGDLQIVSVSDDKAITKKATWLPKNKSGYFVQSYDGNMEIVTKATVDGQICLSLKGMDIRHPDDKSKRIPYWIDYTKLTVNGKLIFDKVTPAWHDKPYIYTLNVKADEEIKIQTEWLPHREDTVNVSANVEELKEKSAKKDALISDLQTALNTEKKTHSEDVELIRKFSDYFTSRIDIKLRSSDEGKLKIVSVSDDKAKVKKADWLPANEIGYFVHSYVGKMDIVAKVIGGGRFNLDLRGLDIRDPADKSKRIPHWIDYTKLTVNGEVLFDKLTPVWHNKPFRYGLDVKDGDEITISVEWQPHRSDT